MRARGIARASRVVEVIGEIIIGAAGGILAAGGTGIDAVVGWLRARRAALGRETGAWDAARGHGCAAQIGGSRHIVTDAAGRLLGIYCASLTIREDAVASHR